MKTAKQVLSIILCAVTILSLGVMLTACADNGDDVTVIPTGEITDTAEAEDTTETEGTTEEVTVIEPVTESTTEESTTKPTEATTEKPITTTRKSVLTKPVATTGRPNPTKPATTEQTTQKSTTTKPATSEHTTEKPIAAKPVTTEHTTKKPVATKPVTTTEKPTTTKPVTTTEKPTTTKPVTTTEKPKPVTTTEKPTAYSCGYKNHDCTSPEQHVFLRRLEKKGCSVCGSHSCRSFYAKDEWGQTSYDVKMCPQYTEKDDPLKYCQYCNRKRGTGDNGTCVRFVSETTCPICHKAVNAKTCHTH